MVRSFPRATAALLSLTRPANAAVAGAGAYAGALLAGGAWAPSVEVTAAMVASILFAAAGNVRNDMEDVEIDRRAHPARALPRGAVTLRAAGAWAAALYTGALVAGALVSWLGLLLVAAAVPVMEGYERWGKARGLPGNLFVALLTGAPFILGGVAVGHVGPAVVALAGLAALVTAGREILKDVEDVEADRPHRSTLPMRIGTWRAAALAALFLVAAVALSPLPWRLETVLGDWYLAAVGAADLCFLAAAVAGFRAPGRGQRWAKVGMVMALLALILGRVHAEVPI